MVSLRGDENRNGLIKFGGLHTGMHFIRIK